MILSQLKYEEESEKTQKNKPQQSFIYACVSYLFVFPIFRFLFKGKTSGISNLPPSGGIVVVSNHGSHLDPPILGHALGRPIAFMAKAELFKVPILSYIISACGAYSVKRGAGDREAARHRRRRRRKNHGSG